jgi:hypothetical protein
MTAIQSEEEMLDDRGDDGRMNRLRKAYLEGGDDDDDDITLLSVCMSVCVCPSACVFPLNFQANETTLLCVSGCVFVCVSPPICVG